MASFEIDITVKLKDAKGNVSALRDLFRSFVKSEWMVDSDIYDFDDAVKHSYRDFSFGPVPITKADFMVSKIKALGFDAYKTYTSIESKSLSHLDKMLSKIL